MVTRLFRVRRVLIVKDVMPDAAIELGMMKSRFMIRLSRWLARRVYQAAHEIHTLGDGMVQRIARLTDDVSKIRIVVDTIDPDELAPVPPAENRFRRQFVPEGTFAVLHTGNMGKKQDLDLLLRAADRLRDDPRFRFYVFGDGVCKDQFLARRTELQLTNVEHHPLQDRAMLRHMLSGADVVLVSQLPEVVDIVFPSKLVTALSAGAMIVVAAAPESEAAKAVVRTGSGLTVPASDDAALVTALRAVAGGAVDTATCRRLARAFALGTFGRDVVYGPIARELLTSSSRSNE
jgi:colanic acid biosynthesis glycosyl transferase WcaI